MNLTINELLAIQNALAEAITLHGMDLEDDDLNDDGPCDAAMTAQAARREALAKVEAMIEDELAGAVE